MKDMIRVYYKGEPIAYYDIERQAWGHWTLRLPSDFMVAPRFFAFVAFVEATLDSGLTRGEFHDWEFHMVQ